LSGTGTLTRAGTGAWVGSPSSSADRELSLAHLEATTSGLQVLLDFALLDVSERPTQRPSWPGRVMATVRDAVTAAAAAAVLSAEAAVISRFDVDVPDSLRLRQVKLPPRAAPPVHAIESISYNSPLEIVLYISSAAGGSTLLGHKVLKLWDVWNASRVRRAESNRAVAGHELQVDALKFLRQQFADATEQDPAKALRAANVLASLDEVNILD
jgi:hypothetical protein